MGDSNPWGLGLAKGTVHLVDHNSAWAQAFAMEAASIRAGLGSAVVDLQHFGSTAVPIRAKPILDLMLGIADFDLGPSLALPLAELGYEFVPNAGVPNDHIFGKGEDRTHLLHVVAHDGPGWRRNIRFRDRMLADPALALAYQSLKERLAVEFAGSRAGYTDAKMQFIDAAVA